MGFLPARTSAAAALAVVLLAGCSDPDPGEPRDLGDSSTPSASTTPTSPTSPPGPAPTTEAPPLPGPTVPGPTRPVPATTPVSTPEPALPKGRVPKELVGEWDGDGTDSARLDKIVFTADGNVALHYNNRQVLRGPAVVGASSMTLYVQGGPVPYEHWSIEDLDTGYGYTFKVLMLDGVSYVRQTSGG